MRNSVRERVMFMCTRNKMMSREIVSLFCTQSKRVREKVSKSDMFFSYTHSTLARIEHLHTPLHA